MPALEEKRRALEEALRRMGSVAVAFSAGVDSTCLLQVASRVLGDRAAAITVRSQFVPQREQQEAAEFCRSRGIRLLRGGSRKKTALSTCSPFWTPCGRTRCSSA